MQINTEVGQPSTDQAEDIVMEETRAESKSFTQKYHTSQQERIEEEKIPILSKSMTMDERIKAIAQNSEIILANREKIKPKPKKQPKVFLKQMVVTKASPST